MALKLIKPGPAVFQVKDGSLTAVTPVTWTVWAAGRIYPPAGTYWVEATTGTIMKKNRSESAPLALPAVVTIAESDLLLIQQMQDGQAIRITPA